MTGVVHPIAEDTALNSDTTNELHTRPLVKRGGSTGREVVGLTRKSNQHDYNPWDKHGDNPFDEMPSPVDESNPFSKHSPLLSGRYSEDGE